MTESDHDGLPGRGRGGRAADREPAVRGERAGPSPVDGRGLRLPRRVDPQLAADGVRLRPRAPGAHQPDAPVRPPGARQPRRRLLQRVPRTRGLLPAHRHARHHRRPVLPGDGRDVLGRRGSRHRRRLRRPRARRRRGRQLRVAVRTGARSEEGQHADRPRGVRRLERRAARHHPAPASRHRRPSPRTDDPGAGREAVRRRSQDARRADQDLVRVPRVVHLQGAGQHPHGAQGDPGRAWPRSSPRSATTTSPPSTVGTRR